MKILTAAEMKACDQATTERFGIPSFTLMRNAAGALVRFIQSEYPAVRRVVILAGRGNNGGDGITAARQLFDLGYAIHLILLGDSSTLKGDAAQAWSELMEAASHPAIHVYIIHTAEELGKQSSLLANDPPTLILDAVVGTGFQPPLRGLALDALNWLQSIPSLPPVVAVDLPSGWSSDLTSDTTSPEDAVYPADAVVTFTAPKPAHLFARLTRRLSQPILVSSIGSPEEAIVSEQKLHWTGAAKTITERERAADSNKGMYGHVLVIGGSSGKSGAPAMASLSALRAGAGLVTAAVAPSVLPLVAGVTPELMTRALAVTQAGEISSDNLQPDSLKSLLKGMTVLAVGPGLGTSEDASAFVLGMLASETVRSIHSIVLDADALNILAKHVDRLPRFAKDRTLVLTPHLGEMGRLTNLSTKEVQADRIKIARDFAQRNNVILVLKGWRTLVAHPDGAIAVNSTGNPAMAKGGSGDLLTGMVAALLAQHPKEPKEAVEAAVYLHGLAADITVARPGPGGDQHTLLATDSLANLHLAYRFQSSNWNGFSWLQGLPSNLYTAAFNHATFEEAR